jgi:hypothetical protein
MFAGEVLSWHQLFARSTPERAGGSDLERVVELLRGGDQSQTAEKAPDVYDLSAVSPLEIVQLCESAVDETIYTSQVIT